MDVELREEHPPEPKGPPHVATLPDGTRLGLVRPLANGQLDATPDSGADTLRVESWEEAVVYLVRQAGLEPEGVRYTAADGLPEGTRQHPRGRR